MVNYIGLNIKYLIDKNNLSQKLFGELVNQSQATIATYVKGRSNPQVETIQKICAHFKITIDDFINIDMAAKGYLPATGDVKQFVEPDAEYLSKDKLIAAQEKTISILEKQVMFLEKEFENLHTAPKTGSSNG